MASPTFTRALKKKLQRERRIRDARRQAAYARLCAAEAEAKSRAENSRQHIDANIAGYMQSRILSPKGHLFRSAARFVAWRGMKVREAGTRRSFARDKGETARAVLRARLGEDIYACWFAAMEFDSFDGRVVRASVPVKFIGSWIQAHYADDLLQCCAAEFTGAEHVEVVLRQPSSQKPRPGSLGRRM